MSWLIHGAVLYLLVGLGFSAGAWVADPEEVESSTVSSFWVAVGVAVLWPVILLSIAWERRS